MDCRGWRSGIERGLVGAVGGGGRGFGGRRFRESWKGRASTGLAACTSCALSGEGCLVADGTGD